MTQTLTCAQCNQKWHRAAQRGRKPKICPTCSGVKVAPREITDANVETLTCQHGNHTWNRAKARGRKPLFCPEHSVQATVETDDGAKKVSVGIDTRPPVVQRVLDGPDCELRRKFAYIVKELENVRPGREAGDLNLLTDTFRRLILTTERNERSNG